MCLGSLEENPTGFRCVAEGHVFPSTANLPVFLRPGEESILTDAEAYAAAWKLSGFAPPPDKLRDLPHAGGTGRRIWAQKARSLEALLRLLGAGRGRKVVDAGAGTGWLSYRLTEAGFRCYATDVSADPEVGLRASAAYDQTPHAFERAIATLARWPVRNDSVDVAVCNASLHYLADIRPALEEAARVLHHDGSFVLMNSPVHADPTAAVRASAEFVYRLRAPGGPGRLLENHRHFVVQELETSLRDVFPRVERHDPTYPLGFRLSRAMKGALLKMELASFPIYLARKA